MAKETIGPKIKKFRKSRGLTQEQLANALGYSHKSVVTHIEKGDAEMSYEKIQLLLKTYKADANELFDIEENFGTKTDIYQNILAFLYSSPSNRKITVYSEVVNTLYNYFEYMDWVGFYEKDENKDELFLSIYVGSEACEKINVDKGVCGKCYREKTTQIVANVHKIPYHIACSSSTMSEIVVPIYNDKHECVAVLDIDSDLENAFDETDKYYLEKIADLLVNLK